MRRKKILETSFNSFCVLLENMTEQLCYLKQLKTVYRHAIHMAFVEIGTYCGGEFHGPSGLYHSFWVELILTWGENRIPEKNT